MRFIDHNGYVNILNNLIILLLLTFQEPMYVSFYKLPGINVYNSVYKSDHYLSGKELERILNSFSTN